MHKHRHASHSGAGMPELLLASALFAVALVGWLDLQRTLLRHQAESWRRLVARWQLDNLAEAMRANPGARYDFAARQSVDCARARCSPDQLAAYEIARVRAALDRTLGDWQAHIGVADDGLRVLRVRYRSADGREISLRRRL